MARVIQTPEYQKIWEEIWMDIRETILNSFPKEVYEFFSALEIHSLTLYDRVFNSDLNDYQYEVSLRFKTDGYIRGFLRSQEWYANETPLAEQFGLDLKQLKSLIAMIESFIYQLHGHRSIKEPFCAGCKHSLFADWYTCVSKELAGSTNLPDGLEKDSWSALQIKDEHLAQKCPYFESWLEPAKLSTDGIDSISLPSEHN